MALTYTQINQMLTAMEMIPAPPGERTLFSEDLVKQALEEILELRAEVERLRKQIPLRIES